MYAIRSYYVVDHVGEVLHVLGMDAMDTPDQRQPARSLPELMDEEDTDRALFFEIAAEARNNFV